MVERAWADVGGLTGISLAVTASFVPTDLANLSAWWDASNSGSVHHTAGAVTTWDDLSGNGRTLTATGAPTTGTRTQNSLNVIDVDGTDDAFGIATWGTLAQPSTVFVVALNDDGADSTNQRMFDADTGATAHQMQKSSANAWVMNAGAALAGGTVNNAAHVHGGEFNGASSVRRVDGASVAAGNAGTNGLAGVRLGRSGGGATWWDGWIAEAIIYNALLSSGDRLTVEAYLKAKWGTP